MQKIGLYFNIFLGCVLATTSYYSKTMIRPMGDGIGGPVIGCLSGNTFEMHVTHFRKDNKEEYGKVERIMIAKVDNPDDPYQERTLADLTMALKGKFVTCNVQYRDKKTDVLICNVFIQNPPEGF